ncbi:hypothetical protein ABZX30_37185 [Streptomyces sp. NPDC004542]|uniref:hypothetical protein n=1 Tax=Streptomyces sp. NPDC004542 TaxID=3154281 RepID=UPI0033B28FA0
MRRWTTGRSPLRALVPRFGDAARPVASGPVYVLPAGESAGLEDTVDALGDGPPDQATVLVAAGTSDATDLWRQLEPVLDECRRSGIGHVRLLWAGGGADLPGRPAPARRIADTWQLEVVAPAGPVVVAPGGSLFTPTGPGGWWQFGPGLAPRPLGLRHPAPSWEDAAAGLVTDAVDGLVVEPVPAGVLVRTAQPAPDAERAVAASIPADSHRLAVVVGTPRTPPVSAQALADLLAMLPERVRATVRLIPGDGRDLLPTGQETADLLGTEVEVVSGIPALLESADGTRAEPAVVLVGADGEPTWRPYLESVACLPAHGGPTPAPRLLRWRSPVPGSAEVSEDGVLALDDEWRIAVTRAGLWLGVHGSPPAEASRRALARETMTVDVGVPGQRLDDGLWPVLDTLMDGLEPSVQGRTTLHVLGRCSAQGRRLLREVTERRQLALEYREEQATGPAAAGRAEDTGEPAQPRTAARAAPHADTGLTEAPWHAEPMSVRIRRVAAPPHPVVEAPAAAAPSVARAPVPPGFAEAQAASRSVGRPGSRSVPVPLQVAGEAATAEGPAAAAVPSPVQATLAAPAPPAAPVPPPPSPTPVRPTGLGQERPPAPTAPVRRAAPVVRVTPLHHSSDADRRAVQAMAGEQWWQQQAAVARTLMVVPGLRLHGRDEDAHADLIAVRSFLTLDDGPLSWRWLAGRLAAGTDDVLPYLSCLASGLRRLPSYRGIVLRDAGVLPAEARALSPGRELREAGPVGTLALDGAPPAAADRYLIWSVTGRRVRGLFAPAPAAGKGEEVVFAPGTRFRALGSHGRPGALTVLLRELADGDPTARHGEHEAQDRAALAALEQAAERTPEAGGARASWLPRLTGPLAERSTGGPDGA